MRNLLCSAALALVSTISATTNANSVTEPDFRLVELVPQSIAAVYAEDDTASPEPAAGFAGQSFELAAFEGLQQKLDRNPFLGRFGVKLTVLDVTDGYATIEMTEGPQAIVDQVAAGFDIADIDLEGLPANRDRQTVVAMRKVLDSVIKQDQLAAILLVGPAAPAQRAGDTAATQETVAAPSFGDQPPEQPASAGSPAPTADSSVAGLDEKTLVMNIQRRLNELGYNAGPADGIAGRGTRAAIREYQGVVAEMTVNGKASTDLLKHMHSPAAVSRPAGTLPPPRPTGTPVMGVWEFWNTATGVYWWGHGVGWELSSMLSNELANTNSFKVVERSRLEAALNEQNLAAGGRIKAGTGAKIGRMTGAQYLVMGTVTAFERNTAGTGGGVSFGGISIGGKKKEAYLAVDLRVVNSTTGELDFVRTVEARAKGGGLSLGLFRGGFGGRLATEKNTPVGKAIRAVVVEITDYLSCAMVEQDNCLAEYDAKDTRRREKTKGSISLD